MRSVHRQKHRTAVLLTAYFILSCSTFLRGCDAGYVCGRAGPSQPLSCRYKDTPQQGEDADDIKPDASPSARMRKCLWRLMPWPFVTTFINLTIRMPYSVPGIPYCKDPRCEVVSSWNAALHHPESDIYLSKSFLYIQGASGHEMGVKEIFIRYLKVQADPLILDIGANIGTHSLWFASLGYRTHSFEPLKRNFALLHCSITATPAVQRHIRINNHGLGAKDMEVCMVSEEKNMGGTHAEAIGPGRGQCAPENIGHVRTLDWYWETVLESKQVFLLKADVEGFEASVVEGGQAMFSTRPPHVMLIEYVPSFISKAGFDGRKFLDRLHELGYVRHNPWTNDTEPVATALDNTDLVLVHKSFLAHLWGR